MRLLNSSQFVLPTLIGVFLASTVAAPAVLAKEKSHQDRGATSDSSKTFSAELVRSVAAKQTAAASKPSVQTTGTADQAPAAQPQSTMTEQQSPSSSVAPAQSNASQPASAPATPDALKQPSATAPASSAAPKATTIVVQQDTSPQRLANTSQGANPYAGDNGFTPMQTVQLLMLAVVLAFFGYMFAQGTALDSMYRWLARVIGVKGPVRVMQSQS